MSESGPRESRAMSTSHNGHLAAPTGSCRRSTSKAPSFHSDITTVENNEEECDLETKGLLRQQTFVVDTQLTRWDLFIGMIWPKTLKRKIEESVKPVYSRGPDEKMFDHDRSPFDLDVHVSPKTNSTDYHTIRCLFDTGCFQGNIISKEFVEDLGFVEADYEPLTTREQYGGQTMNETIHVVEAAILLTWHHNTGPRYRDMRFLISSTLDSHRMIIGTRSIVKHNLLSPPVFMTRVTSKRVHKPLEVDAERSKLKKELNRLDMLILNLDDSIKKAPTQAVREKRQEEQRVARHDKDIQALRIEKHECESNKALNDAKRREHIKKLDEQIAEGIRAETEYQASKSGAKDLALTNSTGGRRKQAGTQAVNNRHP